MTYLGTLLPAPAAMVAIMSGAITAGERHRQQRAILKSTAGIGAITGTLGLLLYGEVLPVVEEHDALGATLTREPSGFGGGLDRDWDAVDRANSPLAGNVRVLHKYS